MCYTFLHTNCVRIINTHVLLLQINCHLFNNETVISHSKLTVQTVFFCDEQIIKTYKNWKQLNVNGTKHILTGNLLKLSQIYKRKAFHREDRYGNVFVGHQKQGLLRYDRNSNRFISIKYNGSESLSIYCISLIKGLQNQQVTKEANMPSLSVLYFV